MSTPPMHYATDRSGGPFAATLLHLQWRRLVDILSGGKSRQEPIGLIAAWGCFTLARITREWEGDT